MKRLLLTLAGTITILLGTGVAVHFLVNPSGTPVTQEIAQEAEVQAQPTPDYRPLTVADIAETGRPQFLNAYATWCPYCQQNDPIVFALQSQFKDQVDFIHLNVDGAGVLEGAAPYSITGVTQYVLLNPDGEIIEKWFGTINQESLTESITSYLESV